MINLIPIEEKKRKIKAFYFRLLIVFLFTLGCCVLIASIVILPAYFISFTENKLANIKLENQKKEPIPEIDQTTLLIIEDLNNKLNLVEKAQQNKFLISQNVIKEIISKKMSDIKITKISYINDITEGELISINGLAPSRERLLLFRQALENDPAFSKVDLPISNFVKGEDIQFYLSLIPAKNEK